MVRKFRDLSIYLECASGCTPRLETIKNYIDIMSTLGYTKLYLGVSGAYHIEDEPEVSEFSMLSGRIKDIRKYDQERPCYVNVYPNWAWGGEDSYLPKLRSFLKTVPVSFLSFDNYPIKMIGGERKVKAVNRAEKSVASISLGQQVSPSRS